MNLRLSDDGAHPPKTTAIRLESLKDKVGPHPPAEHQQLIVVDGHGQDAAENCVVTGQSVELEILCPAEENKTSC